MVQEVQAGNRKKNDERVMFYCKGHKIHLVLRRGRKDVRREYVEGGDRGRAWPYTKRGEGDFEASSPY